jgi:lipoate-protein ligase A
MIFQHGSIPLVLDRELIKKVFREDIVDMEARMTSISELKGPDVSWEDVSARLVDSFSQIFGVRLVNVGLTRDEAERAYVLRREKYDSSLWNDWKTGERDYARI